MRRSTVSILLSTVALVASTVCSTRVARANESSLRVQQEQLIVLPSKSGQSVQVVEIQKVVNEGTTAEPFDVSIPDNAARASLGGNIVSLPSTTANHHFVPWPNRIGPGQTVTVTSAFTLNFNGRHGVQFALHSFSPIDAAYVYLPNGSVSLSANGLFATTQTQVLDGTTFRVFSRLGIQSDDQWNFSLEKIPTPTKSISVGGIPVIGEEVGGVGNTVDALLNLALVGIVFVIGLLGIRTASKKRSRFESQTLQLYKTLQWLELSFASGQLDRTTFETRRRELKETIVRLTIAEESGSRERRMTEGETC